jgi:hypothetical protein
MRFTMKRGLRPGEKIQRGIDFANDVEPGDPITDKVVTATRRDTGADVTSECVTNPLISATSVKATITPPAAGVDIIVAYKAICASGLDYIHDIVVPVHVDI